MDEEDGHAAHDQCPSHSRRGGGKRSSAGGEIAMGSSEGGHARGTGMGKDVSHSYAAATTTAKSKELRIRV